jgi:tryptophan synthase beta chain
MQTKYVLPDSDIPRHWYNIAADLPSPLLPPLNPGTGEPIGPEALAPLFPMELIKQEVSQDRWIDIPDPVRDAYTLWRPSPLYRAHRLEKALDTPAKIFYKYEGVSPTGSHKPNTAIPQAYYNKQEGISRITTETGAGQWGCALAFACNLFDIECKVYMVRISFEQKPYRRSMMATWGAEIVPSPSNQTEAGRKILADMPDTAGSLGIAISEAVEEAAGRDDTKYSLGSVLNHVLLHQTIIGLEAEKQMGMADAEPDIVIGCFGGGSNFAGLAFPYLRGNFGGKDTRIIAVEPLACPTLTKGTFAYDFGDTIGMTPLLPMHTLGHEFVPAAIHSGGLRYHGAAPLASKLVNDGWIEAEAYTQVDCFDAATLFAREEGIIPAPESSHAVKSAVVHAEAAKEEGVAKTILFTLSGHGHFDMSAYDAYFAGSLTDYELSADDIDDNKAAFASFPSAQS